MESFYESHSDVNKNRLYIRLKGFLTDDMMEKAADQVIHELKKLKPGFDVINDISEFKPTSQAGLAHIQRAQKAIQDRSVRRVIRVVNQSHVTAQLQLNRVGKEAYTSAELDQAGSMAEAEAKLDRDKTP